MPQPVSLASLRTAARQRANQETLDETQALVQPQELDGVLNAAIKHLWRVMIQSKGAGFFRKVGSPLLVTVSGQSSYALPLDFAQMVAVVWRRQGSFVTMPQLTENEFHALRAVNWSTDLFDASQAGYQLRGNSIEFAPTPSSGETIELHYIPAFVPLVADTDTFDFLAGFEDYPIWKAAAYMRMKDEDDAGAAACEAQASMCIQDIEPLVIQRNDGPMRVNKVRDNRRRRYIL